MIEQPPEVPGAVARLWEALLNRGFALGLALRSGPDATTGFEIRFYHPQALGSGFYRCLALRMLSFKSPVYLLRL